MKIKRKIALLTLGVMATTTFSTGVLHAAPSGNPPGSNTPSATFSSVTVSAATAVAGLFSGAYAAGAILQGLNTSGTSGATGISGVSSGGPGVSGTTSAAGWAGVQGAGGANGNGVYGSTSSASVASYGVSGLANGGRGVMGTSTSNDGVYGTSNSGVGVRAYSAGSSAISANVSNGGGAAIFGYRNGSNGISSIYGQMTALAGAGGGYAVLGQYLDSGAAVGDQGTGVYGIANTGTGILARSVSGTGLRATSDSTGNAIIAQNTSASNYTALFSNTSTGPGVSVAANGNVALTANNNSSSAATITANNANTSAGAIAVRGTATSNTGVSGEATTGIGVRGTSTTGYGVSSTTSSSGTAVYGLASSTSAGNAATFISNLPFSGYTNLTLNRNGLDFSLSQPELAGTTVDFDITNDGISVIANDNSSGAVSRDHVLTQSSTGTRISSTEASSPFIAGSYLNLGMGGTYGVQLASPSGFQFGQYDNGPAYSGAATFKARLNMESDGALSNPGGNVTINDTVDITGTLEAPTIRTATDGFRAYAAGTTYVGGTFYAQGQSSYILGGITNTSTTVEPNSGGYVFVDDGFRVNSTITQKLTNTAWTTWSDGRLKDIQSSFNKGLAEIMKIDPIIYKYKKDNALGIKDDEDHVGIIAQEIQKVFPEAVTTDEKGFLQFTPDSIYWAMLNAIKELNGHDEVLKAKVTALEAQNKVLEARLSALEAKLK
jgi:hypothetical protein